MTPERDRDDPADKVENYERTTRRDGRTGGNRGSGSRVLKGGVGA